MSKNELIVLLKDYRENKAKLNIKLKDVKAKKIKLNNVDQTDTNIITQYGINQDIHSKNKISNKVLNKIENNDINRQELIKQIKELEEEIIKIKEKVEAIEDRLVGLKYKEREILSAYYIDGRTAENIGTNLYFKMYNRTCSPRYIQKIIEKTINKMVNI